MGIEKTSNLENQKKKSDYKVSKELMETLENFWEESIDWNEGKKYPNKFAYDLIENGDEEIILDHPKNFNLTEKLVKKLIDTYYEYDKSRITNILSISSWLSKNLALELISSKYQSYEAVMENLESFKWLDYEVARRLALKGAFHIYDRLPLENQEKYWKEHFIWIDDNQWQDLLKLSKSRHDSNKRFKRNEIEERKFDREETRRKQRN